VPIAVWRGSIGRPKSLVVASSNRREDPDRRLPYGLVHCCGSDPAHVEVPGEIEGAAQILDFLWRVSFDVRHQAREWRHSESRLVPAAIGTHCLDLRVRYSPYAQPGPLLEVRDEQVDARTAVFRELENPRPVTRNLPYRGVRPRAGCRTTIGQRDRILPVAPEAVAVPVHEDRTSPGRQPLQARRKSLCIDGLARSERAEVAGEPHHRRDVLARRRHRSPGRNPYGVPDLGSCARWCRGPEQHDERGGDHLTPRT
jgi:hypothetical protein